MEWGPHIDKMTQANSSWGKKVITQKHDIR
jgi:hypothetical protein